MTQEARPWDLGICRRQYGSHLKCCNMLFKGQVPSQPYLILFFGPVIREFQPVPDSEFIQGTGWRLALLCGRAEWRLSAWVHRPTWLWLT